MSDRTRAFNPSGYDFLWKVENMDFPFVSIWLMPEYKRRDFIVTNEGKAWRVFIGKEQRGRLGKEGVNFVRERFEPWARKTRSIIAEAKQRIVNESRIDLRQFDNRELRSRFLSFIHFGSRLWRLYFWTEYFCYDDVSRMVEQGDRQLLRGVHRIQKLKLQLRQQINATNWGEGIIGKYLREISRRLGVKDVKSWDYIELANALSGVKVTAPHRSTYIMGKYNGWKVVTGAAAQSTIRALITATQGAGSSVLKGQVGNRGLYRGRVKVIPFDLKANHAQLIAQMKKGDVLVTGSTGPEMILACKKAGTIVTEEGGITSHAATVSRELGIPCVIGTKIATEVLKDGDLIEVDAEQGIVRLLKKA